MLILSCNIILQKYNWICFSDPRHPVTGSSNSRKIQNRTCAFHHTRKFYHSWQSRRWNELRQSWQKCYSSLRRYGAAQKFDCFEGNWKWQKGSDCGTRLRFGPRILHCSIERRVDSRKVVLYSGDLIKNGFFGSLIGFF